MYIKNYDAGKATFEENYAKVSVPMDKIKFRISVWPSCCCQGPEKETDKGQEDHVLFETFMIHMTRAVIFKQNKYDISINICHKHPSTSKFW